jgi:hypothetical protein
MGWLGDVSITKASKTEILVKSYRCAEMVFPRCAGYLAVTNKRVIFHGLALEASVLDKALSALQKALGAKRAGAKCESRIVTEIDVSSVSGVSSYYGHRTNLMMLALGLLLIIVPVSVAAVMYRVTMMWGTDLVPFAVSAVAALFLAVLGITLLCFCRRSVFFLEIFSSQASGAPIAIGEGYGNLSGAKPLFALSGRPTEETDRMITELGAVISDLKEMGDKAVELWGERAGAAAPVPATPAEDGAEAYLRDAAKRLK